MTTTRLKKISIIGDGTLGTFKKRFIRLFKSDFNGLEKLANQYAHLDTLINIDPNATIEQMATKELDKSYQDSDVIVLMLGRNDIRHLLLQIKAGKLTSAQQAIKVKELANQYKALVEKMSSAHPNARIIIVTPAYFYFHREMAPDQYPADSLRALKPALTLVHGDETDAMQRVYTKMFSELKILANARNNISFITNATDESAKLSLAYRAPLTDLTQEASVRVAQSINGEIAHPRDKQPDLTFKHPHEFTDMESHRILQDIYEKWQTLSDGKQKEACFEVYSTGKKLLANMANLDDKKEAVELRDSLKAALAVLNDMKDGAALMELKRCIKDVAPGKRNLRAAFMGALMMLFGVAMMVVAFAVPNPGSVPIAVLGFSIGVVGLGMFNENANRCRMAKKLDQLRVSVEEPLFAASKLKTA